MAVFSQGSWNLVWREDFGVVEDTVIKDFPDPTMSVPNHSFATDCGTINDGYYGIVNSSWWAFNRPKSCRQEAWHLMAGRDHTGNEKGAMLLVNVGSAGQGEKIYEQEINFDLCQNRWYRFKIFAASITNQEYCNANPTKANLTMNVINIKDPSNPVTIKTIATGGLPFWNLPPGAEMWSSTDGGFGDVFAVRDWTEFSVDFQAGDGDKLLLQVLNHSPGGCGNDFVIDDISLYRFDDNEIIDPTISTNTLSAESTTSATGCTYFARFSVPSEVLTSWKNIYSQVYFLWQRSTDDGLTWTNMNTVSGIDKPSIEWEVPNTGREVYRVIITGSTSAVDAKTEAEFIAVHGGPSNGCSYFSISNTLAGVSPEPDCSLKDGLKVVWKEDFGVIDSTLTRTFDGASTLTYYTTTSTGGMESAAPAYSVTCAPDSALPRANQWSSFEKRLSEFYTPLPNDALLYTRLKGKNLVVDKVIQGPFCNCKNYIFSFRTFTLNSWTTMKYKAYIKNSSGTILASSDITVDGSGTPTWHTYSIPFSVDFNYSGTIRLQIEYQGNESWAVPVAFDDLQVVVCQEKTPQGTLYIDNSISKRYLSNFDCGVTPPHIVNLTDIAEWASAYPNYGYVWQSSVDGGTTWQTVTENGVSHYCEDLSDGETLFRVVIGETKTVAQQVAQNGKPTSPCSVYYITNQVGFHCKGVTCTAPDDITITCSDADKVLCTGESATLTPTKQSSSTQFAQEWYLNNTIISGYPKTTDQAVYTVNGAGTYKIKVYDVENPTLQKCTKTAEIEISEAEKPTVTISGTNDYCYGKETVSPAKFTFTGTAPYTFSYSDGNQTYSNISNSTGTFNPATPSTQGTYTYSVSALSDKYCTASSTNGNAVITIKPVPTAIASNNGPMCAGNAVNLTGSSDQSNARFSWTGPQNYTANTASPVLTSTTTAMSGTYTLTTTLNGCSSTATTAVTINSVPTIKTLTASETEVCSGTEITFAATTDDNGAGTATWTTDESTQTLTSSGLTASLKKNVTTKETIKVTLSYKNADGCEATTKTITVVINPIPAAPTVNDRSYCVDAPSSALTATATGTLNWYGTSATGGTASATAPIPSTASAATTTYYVSQTQNECESKRAAITVTVNDKLTPSIVISDGDLCVGESATVSLGDQVFESITWSGDASTYFDGTTLDKPKFTAPSVTSKTTYKVNVSVVDENQCEGSEEASIVVFPLPTATLTASSNSICNLTSTTITASPSPTGGTGTWTNATKTDDVTATFTASEVKTETISYSYVSPDGCTIETPATTTVTVNAIPGAPTTKDVKYCQNAESQTLTATATGTLTWYDADKNPLASAPKPNTAVVGSTTYYVTQTENNCESDYASITVTVNELPKPIISTSKDEVCKGSTITLSLDQAYASQTWICTPTNVLNSTTLATPTIQGTAEAGTYSISVSVKDANECEGVSESKTFEIHPIPVVTLTELTAKCESESSAQTISAEITPAGTEGEGTWNDKVTKLTEYTASFTPSVAKKGTHTITYDFVSDKGCSAAQVSKNVEVYALPEITLAPNQTEVCKGGNNSDVVTMRTTGTATTGTFAYSSTTLTTLDATNGSFDPKNENTETHTITLLYTDEHSCQDTKQTTVKINARPVADVSMNRTDICDYAPSITLTAKVDGNETTGGTFAGTGISASSFSPSTAGAGGPYTITYNYTDATTQCSAEETSFSIEVHHTDAPAVTSASDSKLNVTNQVSVPTLTATGSNIKWYLTNDTTATVVATTNDYQHTYVDDGGYMAVNQYVAFATQTENGCQSVPAEAILTITDCSVTAPTAVKYHACVSESGDGIEVTATSTYANPDTENNFGWFFDRTQIPATTVSSLAAANPDGTGVTFTIPQSRLTAEGIVTVYVAEYDGTAGTQCFSPATAVTIEVHANPVPVIDDPGMICSETQEVTITYSPGTGSTLSGTGISGDKWTPQFDASATGVTTTTLTLDAEKTWGTGTDVTATCSASTALDVNVTNVLAPTGTGIGTEQLWSIGSIASLPAMAISYASDLGATLSVKDSTLTVISTSSPVTMYPRISEIGTYTYDVVQMLNGCTSPTAVSTYKIVECPTPTPQPESVSICAGDNLPTLTANGMNNPDYEWIDVNGTTIGTTETLNVASLSGYVSEQGEYTFRVRQNGLDAAGNECWGSYASATVTINPLPVIEIDDIPVQCYDGGEYEVVATVDGVRSSNGLWTIDNATDGVSSAGIISPSFKQNSSDGDFTLKYEFTNATTHCSNSATKDFHVEYVEVPTPINHTGIITDPKTVQVSVSDIEQGAEYHWYAGQSSTDVLSSDIPYATGDNPETEVEKSYWVSKSVSGCESGRAEATVTIVNCPWTVETVTNVEDCQNSQSLAAMTATAQSNATVQTWKWTNENGTEVSSTDSYTQTSTAEAGTKTYFVSYYAYEPVSDTYCWTPAKEVTTTINSLPEITFDETSSSVCYTKTSERISVTVDYGTNGAGIGEWSVTGDASAINASGIFNPQANGEKSDTYTITYEYTDGKGCVNKNNRTIDVIYLSAPETKDFFAMTSQSYPVKVSVTSPVESEIQWFETSSSTSNSAGTGVELNTGISTSAKTNKSYFARQYKDGCYSEPTEATITIVDCPIPSVIISDETACIYDDVPILTAETSSWSERNAGKSTFRYYSDATASTPLFESVDGAYKPTISAAGTYAYFVSEYNSEPLANLTNVEGCESSRAKVTLTIIETSEPTILATSANPSVCYGNENPTIIASRIQGIVEWYEENPGTEGEPTSNATGRGTSYVPQTNEVGTHSIWAIHVDNGCYSKRAMMQYTVKAIPESPQITNAEICYGEPSSSVSAMGDSESTIVWYSDKQKTDELRKGSPNYSPSVSSIGAYNYYATQIVDDCESQPSEAIYTIKALPSPPITLSQLNICEYDSAPTLRVAGENIKWYAADKTTKIADGESFINDDMSVGSKRFYATQTINGCEGTPTTVTYAVYAQPSDPIVTGASMCAGDTLIPSLTTNLSIDKWYSDINATDESYKATGYNYTPNYEDVSATTTFYVLREQNSCLSNIIPVELKVIQQPNFSIGENIISCIYDSVKTIEATDFEPAINENSYIGWTIATKKKNSAYPDNSEHAITPSDLINEVGTFTISAYYRYKYNNVYCNSNTKSITYTVKNRAHTPIVFSSVICKGEEIKDIQALGSPNMSWMSLSGTKPIYASGMTYKFESQDLDTGIYKFEVFDIDLYDKENNLGCESLHDTIALTVAPAARTKLFGKDSVCVNSTESYYTQYTPESHYYWNVTGDNLNYSKDAGSSSVRYVDWMKSGIDTLTVYEQTWAGCEGFDTLIVKIAARPKPSYSWSLPGASNIIELQDSTIQDSLWYMGKDGVMVGEPIPYTMYWNYGHQGESEDIVDTVINYSNRLLPIQEGDYIHGYNCPILTVENSFGCKEVYKDCIFLEITSSLFVPTAFSPSNPAHSVRTFQPKGYNLKTCEISVYDKWGNLLWYSDAVEDGIFVGYWDGRYEGKPMQSDVYIWKMEATFLDGQTWDGFDAGNGKKAKFGSVTLIR